MTKLRLSLACVATDRTSRILDGRVPVVGCDFTFLPGEPEEIFRRALRDKAFDVTELSMSSHIVTTARGDSDYVGLPIFLSRAYRHSAIYVRSDLGIASPSDLKGKRIGLPEYQQTAALWVRGIMMDQYGVHPRDVIWRTGGLNEPGGQERIALNLPADMDVAAIKPETTLNRMIVSGELDAIISPRAPLCFGEEGGPVVRLFPDFRGAEMAYARQTGFFPIMHCLAIRRSIADANPWLPVELFKSFSTAKTLALTDIAQVNVLRTSLPWMASYLEEAKSVLGNDPWSYGFAANCVELDAMTRYAASDGLTDRKLDPRALFHPSVLDPGGH